MKRNWAPRRPESRPATVRTARPRLEALEDRCLLSTSDGGQWSQPIRVTYSFVPDGTSIGGIPSNLFATMNAAAPTATWEAAFVKAAAIWEVAANINLVLVPDDGAPIGTSGNQQGDSRFGDIRIGAYPESSGQLALTFLPPPVNGGTDAGDIFFNSNVSWKSSSGYDLESVALHEIGHALGLGHTPTANAVMYAYYSGTRQTLSSDDSGGLQSVYGAPSADTANTQATAINLTPQINAQGQVSLPAQYISSISDYDWYKVTVPSTTTGSMTVTMQASNLSSLAPRLAIYNNSTGTLVDVAQITQTNVYGGTATYTVSGVKPGQVYVIRSSAANSGPGSDGAYGLALNFGSKAQAAIAAPNTVVAAQPDKGAGTSNLETQSGQSSKSGGGLLGGLLGGVLELADGLVSDVLDAVFTTIGTLSGWTDSLTVKPTSNHQASAPHHAVVRGSHQLRPLNHPHPTFITHAPHRRP